MTLLYFRKYTQFFIVGSLLGLYALIVLGLTWVLDGSNSFGYFCTHRLLYFTQDNQAYATFTNFTNIVAFLKSVYWNITSTTKYPTIYPILLSGIILALSLYISFKNLFSKNTTQFYVFLSLLLIFYTSFFFYFDVSDPTTLFFSIALCILLLQNSLAKINIYTNSASSH